MGFNQIKAKLIPTIWEKNKKDELKCPHCNHDLKITSIDTVDEYETPFTQYQTVLSCSSCPFKTDSLSYAVSGSIQKFDLDSITISGWAPSGSRTVSKLKHFMDYDKLKDLSESDDLFDFLVIDDHVVKIIK